MGNKNKRVVKLGSVRDVGVDPNNIIQHIRNLDEINRRMEYSRKSDCYIELISLQLQKMELWLRLLISRKTKKEYKKEGPFGEVLKDAKEFLSSALYEDLNDFNKSRIIAIHKFIYGVSSYEEIKTVTDKFADLPRKVMGYVIDNAKKNGPYFQSLAEAEAITRNND